MFFRNLLIYFCSFNILSACNPKKEWQEKTERTCKAQLKITDIELPVTVRLRIAGPTQIFTSPPEKWDPDLDKHAPNNSNAYFNYGVSCRSNIFADQKIQNSPIASLSDQVCSISLSDDQQTRYDLLWHAADQAGRGTISSSTTPGETLSLTNLGREPEFPTDECRVFEAPAKTLHFAEIPIAVEYVQTLRDGYDRSNESVDGKRYGTSCSASNLFGPSYIARHSGRDPGLFQAACSFSGYAALGNGSVNVIPIDGGIKAQLMDAQGKVVTELESKDCQ